MSDYVEHEITWAGINITVRHCKSWLSPSVGFITQHIEVISANREPLSITETGYKSHFMNGVDALIEFDNDAVLFVTQWLDEAAKSPKWAASRQLDLF